jgi:salicylate hydroxylase
MSQGAAQAIEDAAVLAQCLSNVTAKEEVHFALKAFEAIRKPRAIEVQTRSSLNGRIWHCEAILRSLLA